MAERSVPSFLAHGSKSAAIIAAIDWSKHPLGEPQSWPAELGVVLQLMLSSHQPTVVMWGASFYLFINDAYASLLGPEHVSPMGRSAPEVFPEGWAIVGAQVRRVLETGEPAWEDDRLVPQRRQGKLENVYWSYSYSPVRGSDGKVQGIYATHLDTTHKVVALDALRKSEGELFATRAELRGFLEQAPIGVCILSGPHHAFTFINDLFMATLFGGRSKHALLDLPVRQALPEIAGQGWYELLDRTYTTGEPLVGKKVRAQMVQADGHEREMFVNFSYNAKRNQAGEIDGIIAVVYEVTDQVNEQKEIETLARDLSAAIVSRDNFLAIASHELKTPLTSLKLQTQRNERFVQSHAAQEVPPDRFGKFLRGAREQIARLERLINDMLDVSRINTGKLSLALAACDMRAVVHAAMEALAPQMEAAGCTVRAELGDMLVVEIDATRIEQVIGNLLINATKYAPNAPVDVRVRRDGNFAQVRVRDHGKGIAAGELERIFGRFERAVSRNEVSGLGLGLYIAKQIIQEHHGNISVDSEVGKGTEFMFQVPLVQS